MRLALVIGWLATLAMGCASFPRVSEAPLQPPAGGEWLQGEGAVRLYASTVLPEGEPVGVVSFVVHPEIGAAPMYPDLTGAMQADPLVVRYFSMRYMLAQKQVMDRCATNAGAVAAPLLLLQGEKDLMVDPSGNEEILAAAKSGDKTRLRVPGGGHGSSSVETMVEPIVGWLQAHLP